MVYDLAFCNIDIQLIIILIFAKTIICYETVTLLKLLFTNSLSDSSRLVKTDYHGSVKSLNTVSTRETQTFKNSNVSNSECNTGVLNFLV